MRIRIIFSKGSFACLCCNCNTKPLDTGCIGNTDVQRFHSSYGFVVFGVGGSGTGRRCSLCLIRVHTLSSANKKCRILTKPKGYDNTKTISTAPFQQEAPPFPAIPWGPASPQSRGLCAIDDPVGGTNSEQFLIVTSSFNLSISDTTSLADFQTLVKQKNAFLTKIVKKAKRRRGRFRPAPALIAAPAGRISP